MSVNLALFLIGFVSWTLATYLNAIAGKKDRKPEEKLLYVPAGILIVVGLVLTGGSLASTKTVPGWLMLPFFYGTIFTAVFIGTFIAYTPELIVKIKSKLPTFRAR